jgi:hypothetical protein
MGWIHTMEMLMMCDISWERNSLEFKGEKAEGI